MWKYPNDRDKLDNLEMIARNLLHDKDKDVSELAQKVIAIIRNTKTALYLNSQFLIKGDYSNGFDRSQIRNYFIYLTFDSSNFLLLLIQFEE